MAKPKGTNPRFHPALLLIALFLVAFSLCCVFAARAGTHRIIEIYASHRMHRPVTIGSVTLTHSNGLHIDLADVHIANAEWGSAPDYISLAHLTGDLDISKLLHGHLQFNHMAVEGIAVLLERDEHGTGNWRTGGNTEKAPAITPSYEVAHDRKSLPVFLDLILRDSAITMITSSKHKLVIAFKTMTLYTGGAAKPVHLQLQGAYNDIPVNMVVEASSFDAFHDVDHPFKAKVQADAATLKLMADLALMDPLNADQFTGTLGLDVGNIGKAAALIGSTFNKDLPFSIKGNFARKGDDWSLSDADGKLGENRFADSQIALTEGQIRRADDMHMDMNFTGLDLNRLVGAKEAKKVKNSARLSFLDAKDHPSVLIDLMLAARQLTYRDFRVKDVKLRARLMDGLEAIEDMRLTLYDGILHGSVSAKTIAAGNEFSTKMDFTNLDTAIALRATGKDAPIITGRADLALNLGATGETQPEILRNAHGNLSLTMKNGGIAQRVMRLAAQDMHGIGDRKGNFIPLNQLDANLRVVRGIGTVSSFSMATANGTLLGHGTVDLPNRMLDLTLQTDPKTTSGLALDIPVHLTGPLDKPVARPVIGGK